MSCKWIVVAVMPWCVAVMPASAQVTISGGRDPAEMNMYRWTLSNDGTKPVVRFEFPRHVVDIVAGPPDWTSEVVRNTPDGKPLDRHRIVVSADMPTAAIRPGQTGEFSAIITIDRATPARQTAVVGFADGTAQEIPGVEVPWDVPWLEKHALLIGMGTLFALFLLVQAIRSRRGRAQPATAGE